MTGILDRLELHGLVTRERRPEDKRWVRVTVTAAGTAATEVAPPRLVKRLTEALKQLPEKDRVEVHRVILYLADLIDTHDATK